MYRELLIFPQSLKGQPIFPDTSRELIAKACDGLEINPQIFARQANGQTINHVYGHTADGQGYGAVPAVCFGGGSGLIRMYGMGQHGADLLMEEAATIGTAVSKLLGTSYAFKLNEGRCEITPNKPGIYRIRNLVVAKKRYQFAAIADGRMPTLEEMTPLIRNAIVRGITGQAMAIDEQCENQSEILLAGQIPNEGALDVRIFHGKPVFIPLKKGKKACALGIHNLEFTMNLRLSGPWFAGHLRSRGFGYIQKGRYA